MQKCFVLYRRVYILTFIATKSLKLFLTLNCLFKRVNNDFILTHFTFDASQKFEAVPHEQAVLEPVTGCQTHSRDKMNILGPVQTPIFS